MYVAMCVCVCVCVCAQSPNPEDPLNKEAAQMMVDHAKTFEQYVQVSDD